MGLVTLWLWQAVVRPRSQQWQEVFGHVRLPQGYTIRGIDVSHHQGQIDWDRASRASLGGDPVSFAFVKATEGASLTDPAFRRNISEARESGLVVGAYHYFRPEISAREQAEYFCDIVQLEPGDLPPVLDIEEAGSLRPDELRRAALEWLRLVRRHYGVRPIIYSNYAFRQRYLQSADFQPYPYWIAHYYRDHLQWQGPWKFWQHTDQGRLPGIPTRVDLNCYNGSMYDLQQLTIQHE